MIYGIVCVLTAALSAAGTWLLGKYLLSRLGMRELGVKDIPATVRDVPGEGEYIPRCGGLLPCFAVLVSAAVMLLVYNAVSGFGSMSGISRLSSLQSAYIWYGLMLAPLCCAAGFMEDYATVFRGLPEGLPGWQRTLIYTAITAAYLAAVWLSGDRGEGLTLVPFAGEVRMGLWYYLMALMLIPAVVRGAELAQEADGVMPTVGFFSFLPLIVAAGLFSEYNAGLRDAGLLAVAAAGGCIAFATLNYPPARARTGVAGGAFMGALLCGTAFACRMPVLLFLCGGVYIAESATALFAWASGRLTGKTVGAPLHRMIGRRDKDDIDITLIFAAITALCGTAAGGLTVLGQ